MDSAGPKAKSQALRQKILALTEEYFDSLEEPLLNPGEAYLTCTGSVLDGRDMAQVVGAALDQRFVGGVQTMRFESKLAARCRLAHACMTNSGSSANLVAFAALTSTLLGERRILPGSEVLTVAAGFPTTVSPIIHHNCVPVYVDVELATANVDITAMEAAITPKTRAIMLAHTLGNPFDLKAVSALAQKHHLYLIEDCCDAFGASYQGRPVGTWGDLATLSFYPAHHMTTGEGGAVLTDSGELMRIVRSFRDWGRDCWCRPGTDNSCGKRFDHQLGDLPEGYDHKYIYTHVGYNLKATDLQASLGISQLDKVDSFLQVRERNMQLMMQGMRAEKLDEIFHLPQSLPDAQPSWFGFLLTLRDGKRHSRRELVHYLESRRIATRMLFGGNLTRQPGFMERPHRVCGTLENTDKIMRDSFWIGLWPGLSERHIDYMVQTIKSFFRQ